MSQTFDEHDIDDFDERPMMRKARQRSEDYDKKRRRAESILEQARLRELLGFDVDYPD
ncbi:hypothetical protein [Parathalassolituus penaei]|uniref:Uncharacterized protein n=1 Tax=Parathalassolituus penaei TaxID=2997323 RepID=A0A9X3IQJ1_9GAMM|nr:hypothetical protein [Parathalassolituus penaei]MCY0964222.1 hypothetical protein [Parathalassolituus penaei]